MKPTSSFRVTLAIAWKDLQLILKDRGLLLVIIVLPMIFSIMNGLMNQRVASAEAGSALFPVALVNLDQGAYGQQIEKTLGSIDVLKVTRLDSVDEARQQVADSKVLAAITLPAGLTDRINAYQPSQVDVLTDPTQKQFSSLIPGILKEVISPAEIQGEISFAIRTLLSEYPAYQQADAQTRQAYESQNVAVQMSQVAKMSAQPWISVTAKTESGKDMVKIPSNIFVLLIPSFSVFFAFFIVGDIAVALLQEKKDGSMRRVMAAPIRPWMIVAAKMLAYIVLVLIQVAILFGVANLAFDMPLGHSLPALILVSIAVGLAATALGVMLASFTRTHTQANNIGLLVGFVIGPIGGCFTFGTPVPLYKSGGMIQTIANLTPHAHALAAYDVLLNEGGGLMQVLPQVGILLGFAAVGFALASWRFKFE